MVLSLNWAARPAEQMPFDGYDIPTVKEMVCAGERPKPPLSCPRIVQRLFSDCWAQEYERRPPFTTVVSRRRRRSPPPFTAAVHRRRKLPP